MQENIEILKPGETGYGIMIEQDAGYISPNDDRNKPFINEINKIGKGEKIIEEPLIIYVVLQKYGVENRNGRIYSKEILYRENDNYQELIRQNRALGECVPRDTEIFTKKGWKKIQDMKVGEDIFTLNVKNNKLEIQPIQKTTDKIYNDDMIHIYNSSSLDMLVTKKHKIVLWDRNDNPYILTAEELYEKIKNRDSKVSHSYIKNSGDWTGESIKTIKIPNSNYEIDAKLWAKFLGIFIADGHCAGTKGGEKVNKVTITQVKDKNKNKIIEILDELPFKYYISDNRQFNIIDKALHEFLFELGNSNEKHVPEYVKNWDIELLNILLDWLLIGDGRNRKDRNGNLMKEYYTISDKLSEDVFEILLKISNGATFNKRTQIDRYITEEKNITEEIENDGVIELVKKKVKNKRLIKAENSKPLNIISEKRSKGISLDNRFIKTEKVPFNDNVYCVTVDNGTWLMKYNNKISWTHNSDHPDTSIISNDRISHNIIETWWEGKTLMGKMEIIMSPGFVNYGIISCQGDQIANLLRKNVMIGVSSRGVGSLQEIDGKSIVQDDFELICWDIVTSPSTPGSWVARKKENLGQFVEQKQNKKDILIENLNDFLTI